MMRFLFTLVVCGAFALRAANSPAQPTISSIEVGRTNITVTVMAPAGVQKVSLESRLRVDGSAWSPRAIHRFAAKLANPTEIKFELTHSERLEVLRVRADVEESLPLHFFTGTSYFSGAVTPINTGTTTGTDTGTSTGTTAGTSTSTGTTGATST